MSKEGSQFQPQQQQQHNNTLLSFVLHRLLQSVLQLATLRLESQEQKSCRGILSTSEELKRWQGKTAWEEVTRLLNVQKVLCSKPFQSFKRSPRGALACFFHASGRSNEFPRSNRSCSSPLPLQVAQRTLILRTSRAAFTAGPQVVR